MSKGKVVLIIAAGMLAIYVVAAPYVTVYQMKSAAESHDGETLSEYIEFPSVRKSLKDQMNVMFAKKMAEDEEMKNNPFAAVGMAFAGVMVDKLVDVYVTPAGITQLMAGEKPQRGAEINGENADDPEHKPLSDSSMAYESHDKFVVKVKGDDGEEGKFILRRRGLSWKLTDIIIPLEW